MVPSRVPILSKGAFTLIKIAATNNKEEQLYIAHILSTVQSAIENRTSIIKTTEELKKAMMKKLFTEGLYGERQKETEIGDVPESWKIVKLYKTGEVIYGIQAAVANLLEPIGTKILTNKNITIDGKLNLETINYYKLKSKRDYNTILKKGDILFNWRSGSKEHVGKTAYFDLDGEFIHSSFILRIRVEPDIIIDKYLYYYLNYLRSNDYFVKLQTYSINAKFNKSAVNELPVSLPLLSEQKEIVQILTTIDRKIEIARAKKETLKSLFKTLLHELMTGKIRVRETSLPDFATEFSFPVA